MVLIDTSAWIDFFHDFDLTSPVGQEVDSLLAENRVVTTGVVLAEVLQGASDDADLVKLQGVMGELDFIEADKAIWRMAAEWSYQLKRKGLKTPLSDLVIAAAAISGKHAVFTTDPHFQRVDNLTLHQIRA